MKQLLLLVLITVFSSQLVSQAHMTKQDAFYTKFHFERYGNIFTYCEDYLTYQIDTANLYNQYLELAVLNIKQNLSAFFEDEQGIFLPYEDED